MYLYEHLHNVPQPRWSELLTFTNFSPKSCLRRWYIFVYWSKGTSLNDPLLTWLPWASPAHLQSLGSKISFSQWIVGHNIPSLSFSDNVALSISSSETLMSITIHWILVNDLWLWMMITNSGYLSLNSWACLC